MTDAPTFVVRRWEDGEILDVITPDELVSTHPWHEAACWAHLAVVADRKLLDRLDDQHRQPIVPGLAHPDDAELLADAEREDMPGSRVGDELAVGEPFSVGGLEAELHDAGGYR